MVAEYSDSLLLGKRPVTVREAHEGIRAVDLARGEEVPALRGQAV